MAKSHTAPANKRLHGKSKPPKVQKGQTVKGKKEVKDTKKDSKKDKKDLKKARENEKLRKQKEAAEKAKDLKKKETELKKKEAEKQLEKDSKKKKKEAEKEKRRISSSSKRGKGSEVEAEDVQKKPRKSALKPSPQASVPATPLKNNLGMVSSTEEMSPPAAKDLSDLEKDKEAAKKKGVSLSQHLAGISEEAIEAHMKSLMQEQDEDEEDEEDCDSDFEEEESEEEDEAEEEEPAQESKPEANEAEPEEESDSESGSDSSEDSAESSSEASEDDAEEEQAGAPGKKKTAVMTEVADTAKQIEEAAGAGQVVPAKQANSILAVWSESWFFFSYLILSQLISSCLFLKIYLTLLLATGAQVERTRHSGTGSAGRLWTGPSSHHRWQHMCCRTKHVCSMCGWKTTVTGAKRPLPTKGKQATPESSKKEERA